MRGLIEKLGRDRRGSTAFEFAAVVPVMVLALFSCLQFGILFYANAGLQNAIGEGARLATLWPRRNQAQIAAQINASDFGLDPARLQPTQFSFGRAGGQDFVQITMTYNTELNFLFFRIPGVTLTETRRAYLP
jgi:Flp pilus assembly protein TadG